MLAEKLDLQGAAVNRLTLQEVAQVCVASQSDSSLAVHPPERGAQLKLAGCLQPAAMQQQESMKACTGMRASALATMDCD